MLRRALLRLLDKVGTAVDIVTLPSFATRPRNLRIGRPRQIVHPERVFVGDDVWLGRNSVIAAYTEFTSPLAAQRFDPVIRIGNRVGATAVQIHAVQEVTIEDDVIMATNVFMADSFHGYANANQPYRDQPLFRIAPIRICRGCWIGQNVVLSPGVTVGEFSIIGANSVVTSSIPARSIAVGAPARVIKTWSESDQRWVAADDAPGADNAAVSAIAGPKNLGIATASNDLAT